VEARNFQGQPILSSTPLPVLAAVEPPAEFGTGKEHRLVALDLRGHGLSDKPRDGYSDSKLWADDIHAVIRELNLARPVPSGWSSVRWYSSTTFVTTARGRMEASILSAASRN
jgi:pimeloyl-ACP methyl ester carboxylesterase